MQTAFLVQLHANWTPDRQNLSFYVPGGNCAVTDIFVGRRVDSYPVENRARTIGVQLETGGDRAACLAAAQAVVDNIN